MKNILSIGAPEGFGYLPQGYVEHPCTNKLRLGFDDIERHSEVYTAPSWDHVQEILDFTSRVQGHVLTHCAAGVSRSSAAAWIVLCAVSVPGNELELLTKLKRQRACIRPNRRLVWMADELLGREGRMKDAIDQLFPAWDRPQIPPRSGGARGAGKP